MTFGGYLKLFQLQHNYLGYDTILLDEAQDTNPVSMAIVMDQIKHGTKVLLVGDPLQSIYSWRGAIDAMDQVNAHTMRLTQSFRFGPTLGELATNFLHRYIDPKLPPLTGAGPDTQVIAGGTVPSPVTYLTRSNSGQIEDALDMIRKSNGRAKVGALDRQGFNRVLEGAVQTWYFMRGQNHKMTDRFMTCFDNYDQYKNYCELANQSDRSVQIQIAEKYNSRDLPLDADTLLSAMVPVDEASFKLITGHKAKGGEWDNVLIGNDFTDPEDIHGEWKKIVQKNPNDPKALPLREEQHLHYVAITRAKKWLGYDLASYGLVEKYGMVAPPKPSYTVTVGGANTPMGSMLKKAISKQEDDSETLPFLDEELAMLDPVDAQEMGV